MPHYSHRAMVVCTTVFLCATFAHPIPSLADQSVTLKGQILTKDGQAVSGATVSLESSEGGTVGNRPADSFGNYQIEGFPAGRYQLTVTAEKYQVYQQSLDLTFRGETYTVNVYLTATNKTEVKVPPALTDEAAPKPDRKEFDKGEQALEKNKLPEARRHLEKAVADYPCYARAQVALAQVDLHERKLDNAEACFKKAIQCDGSFLDSFSELAQLYVVEKKFAEGEGILNAGLRLSPQAWLFHYQMGLVHHGMQKYPEAVQDYLQAQALHSQMPTAFHIKLGNTYLKTGAYDKALAEFQTYLRLDPKGQFAPGARKMSDMMLKDGITAATASPPSTPPASKP
jgi:tetratricopeptide (TPR) repeat protein